MSVFWRNFACRTALATLGILNLVYGDCWNGWIRYNNSCYLFTNAHADWHEAQFDCEIQFGGYLAEINSVAENKFLKNEARIQHSSNPSTANAGYWIGGSDMEVEGDWLWMKSRQPLQITDWAPGQPDDHHKHEDCLILYGVAGFQWNDGPCTTNAYFICEKPNMPDQTEIIG